MSSMLKIDTQSRTLDLGTILSEIRTLSHPVVRSHANIIRLLSWGFDHPCSQQSETVVPLLFIEKALASVQELLSQRTCSIKIKHQLCLDTAEGLACLHSHGILHADLNPKNVLVVERKHPDVPFIAKLSDFGSSIHITDDAFHCYGDYLGTPGWIPPEVERDPDTKILGAELFKCDSWAFGMFVFSVLYENAQKRPKAVPSGISIGTDLLSKKLSKDCLLMISADPARRPEVSSDVLNDESKNYADWLSTKAENPRLPMKTDHEHEYSFWNSVDTNTLSRLDLEYHALESIEGISVSSHDHVLFGMALAYFRFGYSGLGLSYVQKAARADSDAAKGILYRLTSAMKGNDIFSASDKRDLEIHRERWLLDAVSSGSLLATLDMHSMSTKKIESAKDLFRHRGGYEITVPSNSRASGQDFDKTKTDSRTGAKALVDDSQTGLYLACAQGDYGKVTQLTSAPIDASFVSKPFDISCLHWLFVFKRAQIEDVAKRLLTAGSRLESCTTTPMEGKVRRHIPSEHFPFHWPIGTPLHWACFTHCWTAMSVLLDLGADVDALDDPSDDQAQTPLAMAMYRGDSEVVKFLLNRGANPQRVDGKGRNPLHMLALDYAQNRLFPLSKTMMWRCYHREETTHLTEVRRCVAAVVKAGGDIECRRSNGQTPLLDALESKDGGVVMALLEAEAKVDCRFAHLERLPVLHWLQYVNARSLAYPNLYLPVLEMLLSKSIGLNTEDAKKRNLFHGVVFGAPTSLEDHISDDPNTLYHYTEGALQLLRASPFSTAINSCDIHGDTPLTLALHSYNDFTKYLIDLLLKYGASLSDDRYNRQDVIWSICDNSMLGDELCVDLLKAFCANVPEAFKREAFVETKLPNVKSRGRSALQCAIRNGFLQTVEWMLSVPDLDLNRLSEEGFTPLDSALDKADRLRVLALGRWDRFATTTPKHRRGLDYDGLFWTPKWNPNIGSYKLSKYADLVYRGICVDNTLSERAR